MDKIQLYITEAQKQGIKVLPPDINKSNSEFTPDENNIRFGLNSIKGIGDAVLAEISEEKTNNGEFKSVADFAKRINPRVVNKKAMENLTRAGAFTELEPSRKKLFNNIDNILNAAAKENEAKEKGQVSLFAGLNGGSSSFQMTNFELYGSDEEFSDKEIQEFEKELLGFYVTSHPLEAIRDKLPFLTTHNISDLDEVKNETFITICGLITSVRTVPTKKDPTKFLKSGILEDLTGEIPFVAFHKTLEKFNSLIEAEKKVILSGKYQRKDENNVQLIVENVKPVENSNIVTISFKGELPFEKIVAIKDIIANHKGNDPLVIKPEGDNRKILTSSNFWLNTTNDLIQTLEKNFGESIEVRVNSLE